MKSYTLILSILLVLVLVISCSPQRENISNLRERLDNFFVNETLILAGGEPFTGIAYEEYSNGRIDLEVRLKNGIPNGILKNYRENGLLWEKATYKDGELHGPFELYRVNGLLWEKGTKKNGELDGLYELYHENGELKEKAIYKAGERDGLYESYRENGELKEKATYKDGERDGLYESYHENGQLWKKITYKGGERHGPYESYHENGQLWGKGIYKDGLRDGFWEYYHKDGVIVELKSTEVYNPFTGVIWMDRNIGADRVALRRDDSESFGSLFTYDEAVEACPSGYRLPTDTEWKAERQSWSRRNSDGAINSPLKLPMAGYHNRRGWVFSVGSRGNYWSSTVINGSAGYLRFSDFGAAIRSVNQTAGYGHSVRCLKK